MPPLILTNFCNEVGLWAAAAFRSPRVDAVDDLESGQLVRTRIGHDDRLVIRIGSLDLAETRLLGDGHVIRPRAQECFEAVQLLSGFRAPQRELGSDSTQRVLSPGPNGTQVQLRTARRDEQCGAFAPEREPSA